MDKELKRLFEKSYAYANAIMALAEKNSSQTDEEFAIGIVAMDLSNCISRIEEKLNDGNK